ncbi:MAG: Wzz/FepE/Etk N-terminal domain-containing protein, partial [Roseiarcus sp.]
MLDQIKNVRTVAPSATEEAQGFDLHGIINFLWRRWKLIVGVTALAMLIALIYLARATPL